MDCAQILLQAGLVTQEQILQALELQKETGSPLPYVVCKLRFADEVAVAGVIARASDMAMVDLEGVKADAELLAKFPASFLEKNRVLPLGRIGGGLRVGVVEPCPEVVLDELRLISGDKVELVVVPPLTALGLLADALEGRQDAGDGKLKRPHRHADGRAALSDLVQELEGQAQNAATAEPIGNADELLYSFETRELLFALIKTLCEQGLVQKEEIIRAAQEL